ncbi:MAG: hypothetical protein BJ554DRAFT_3947 [Olpidium bornovanus]|uniref:Uncharacterized protein n=1 Tax=Olpidium bornovanus TaxID=278681 RepID=A0A8H7ZNE0_9FUNG|nr:MAG: hypothetical protein BJ554DRAFT_3947 [Olpidium bornovanus]
MDRWAWDGVVCQVTIKIFTEPPEEHLWTFPPRTFAPIRQLTFREEPFGDRQGSWGQSAKDSPSQPPWTLTGDHNRRAFPVCPVWPRRLPTNTPPTRGRVS